MNQENNENRLDTEEESVEVVGADISDDIVLSTFSSEQSSEKKPKKYTPGTRKKIIALIAIAVCALALLLVYLLVLAPMLAQKQEENESREPDIPLIEGEVRAENGNSVLLYKYINKADTKKITVTNPKPGSNDSFSVLRSENDENIFYIDKYPTAPVSAETYLKIISAAGNTVINRRVLDSCDDLSVYGLADSDYPRKVTIEDMSGQTYSFYIGDLIPSEGGYYCRAEGRSAVYIIATASLSSVLSSPEVLITPIVGPQIPNNEAFQMDQVIITKNGQLFVSIYFTEINTSEIIQSTYLMTHPAQYIVNDDKYSESVLSVLASLQGNMVVASGNGTTEGLLYKDAKLMAKYGFYDLDNPLYEVIYAYGDYVSRVIFTDSGSDAFYYAYSYFYDTIVLVEKSSVSFLEWDLMEYINRRLFFEHIQDIQSMSVTGTLDNYYGSSYSIDEKFSYIYDDDANLTCVSENTLLNGKKLTYSGKSEESNFIHAFYQTVLMLNIDGYISEAKGFDMSKAKEIAKLTVEYKKKSGEDKAKIVTYRFYEAESGNKCYFTIDGAGDFYINRDAVRKLMINASRAANNCKVDIKLEQPEMPKQFLERVD